MEATSLAVPGRLLHDPAHRARAGAGAADPLQTRHLLDRILRRDLARRHLREHLGIAAHVASGEIRLGQNLGEVAEICGRSRARYALGADHLPRGLALATEETPVRNVDQVFPADSARRAMASLQR